MALFGINVPHSRKPQDREAREEIFQIIAPYCFSSEDMAAINEYPDKVKDLWFISFTNSQQVMIFSKLVVAVKDHFRSYFPDNGASPRQSLGQKVGLMPGQSILDR
jgi:hypothetical protein